MNAKMNRFIIRCDLNLSCRARFGFIKRPDDCAGNRELDQVAGNPAAEDLGRQWLHREGDEVSAGVYQRYQDC